MSNRYRIEQGIYQIVGSSPARYRLVVTRKDGSKWVETVTCGVKEARIRRNKMLTEVAEDASNTAVRSAYTVERYWREEYLPSCEQALRKPTVATYRTAFKVYILPSLGKLRLSEITPMHIRKLREKLETTLAPSTVVTMMAPLKAMLNAAVEDDVLKVNVMIGKRRKRHTADSRAQKVKKVRDLTDEEIRNFYAALKQPTAWGHPPYALFFRVLEECGPRISEAVALRWCDVESDRIHIRRRFAYAEMIEGTKTGVNRVVPITSDLAWALRAWQADARWDQPEDLVFPNPANRPLDDSHLSATIMHPTMRTAGIAQTGFHAWRHTFCTRAINHYGWNELPRIARMAGNSPEVLASTYYHLRPDDLLAPIVRSAPSPAPIEGVLA